MQRLMGILLAKEARSSVVNEDHFIACVRQFAGQLRPTTIEGFVNEVQTMIQKNFGHGFEVYLTNQHGKTVDPEDADDFFLCLTNTLPYYSKAIQ